MPPMWDTAHKVVLANLGATSTSNLGLLNKRNVNAISDLGTTPLHFAALSSTTAILEHLLTLHANVNAKNYYGESPLHWACKSGYPEIVLYLLENGASPAACDSDGNSLLHWAAEYDHLEIIKILLDRGCKINEKNTDHESPIDIASFWCNPNSVQLLLDRKADLGAALLIAMKNDFSEVIDMILQKLSFSKKEKPFPRAPDVGKAVSEQIFDLSKASLLYRMKEESSRNRIQRRKRLRNKAVMSTSQKVSLPGPLKKETPTLLTVQPSTKLMRVKREISSPEEMEKKQRRKTCRRTNRKRDIRASI